MNRVIFCLLNILVAAGVCLAPSLDQAQGPPPPVFPFVIPWDDSTPGTATDVSFLNAKPAGVNGPVVPRSGHFAEAATGKRVRFLGVNFAAGAAFPGHADAEKVAARLAKLGVNIVRLHHMDNNWSRSVSIWNWDYKDRQHIDPGQLDRLDYLIAQLKKNGVYVNLNLHVSREFSEADGFPASVKQLGYAKRVDNFDRRMIQLQKDYARDLLTHVNPYTQRSYAEDPCVAVVEVNNENSLVGDPWATLGAGLADLPEPFRGELVGLWNTWLAKKYGTDDALKAAWLQGTTPVGAGMLTLDAEWSLEHQGTSEATLKVLPTAQTRTRRTAPDVEIDVSRIDATDWHVQVHQTGLDFRNGATYTVRFRAKADKPRSMGVTAGLDQPDWRNVGLSASAQLGVDWKTFRFLFEAHDVAANHNRIAFVLGNRTGTVRIADLLVAPGAEGAGLPPGQSPAAKTVDIPASATKNQKADWMAFLADTERAYADEMRAYLKDTLKVKANLIDSQISWGGLTGVNREANMEFADNHAYWQHPSFPHRSWDSRDWNIGNTSMVASLADGRGGALSGLALYRVVGKPYTVSEYNHPAPNDYQAEMMPVYATYAAYQDWDMIYLFDYGDYGEKADNAKIQGFFGIGSNPAKTAFLPASAILFRAFGFGTPDGGWTLQVPRNELGRGITAEAAWREATKGALPAFATKTALSLAATGASNPQILTADGGKPASRLEVVKTPSGGSYLADAPGAQAVAGFVGGQKFTVGPTTFAFPTFGNNFAALTLTPMDGKALAQSRRLLLTLVGRVENQGMVWNAERTSVGDQWGHGPTVAEGIPAALTLKTEGALRVYALDGMGRRTATVASAKPDGTQTINVGPQDRTLWYEITDSPATALQATRKAVP
jgi:hypothetical protein